MLLLWAKSNQKPFRAAKPAVQKAFSIFCGYSGSCPLLLWTPRLDSEGLAERPASLSSSVRALMEIEKHLHAAIKSGLSGPGFFPASTPKHFKTSYLET